MDIALTWNADTQSADIGWGPGDLTLDAGLGTSVILSLFTNRKGEPDVQIYGSTIDTSMGYWADSYTAYPLGSRLWQLNSAKKVGEVTLLQKATTYAEEALAWLVAEGIARRVDVRAVWLSSTAIGLDVTIHKPDGSQFRNRYDYVWQGQRVA